MFSILLYKNETFDLPEIIEEECMLSHAQCIKLEKYTQDKFL